MYEETKRKPLTPILLVFLFSLIHSTLQEKIVKSDGFHFGLFLSFWEHAIYILFSLFHLITLSIKSQEQKDTKDSQNIYYYSTSSNTTLPLHYTNEKSKGPQLFPPLKHLQHYLLISILLFITISSGNKSMEYLNYPTKVIFKSSKILPTMIWSIFILNRSYPFAHYMAALSLSFGLFLFSTADASVSPSFHFYGIVLVMTSVISEAICSNIQEKTLRVLNIPRTELLLYTNLFSALLTLGLMIFGSNELYDAIIHFSEHTELFYLILAEATFGYLNVNSYLTLVEHYGIAMTMFIANIRKVITIILSFVLFPKPFTPIYIIASIFSFFALFLLTWHSYRSYNPKSKA